MSQGCVAIGRAGHFRQPVHHRRAGVQHPLMGQGRGQQTGERLGHRHGMVRDVGRQRAAIGLVDHLAAMQHDQPVREIDIHGLAPGHGLAILCGEAHRVQVIPQPVAQRRRRARAAPDSRRGAQFPLVTEAPAMVGKAAAGSVRHPQHPIRRRREADHQSARYGVTGLGVEGFTHDVSFSIVGRHPIRNRRRVQAQD